VNSLGAVQSFFSWLVRHHQVPYNPASDLVLPRSGCRRRLPRGAMSYEEVERVLAQVDVSRCFGLRDRTMMEVLYSTGLRRGELVHLRLDDLVPERGVLEVHEGKGRKDRVVPIGSRALDWVARYLREVRPRLVVPPDGGWLFLTYKGTPFRPGALSIQLREHVRRALPGSPGSCHVFRHTAATLMLENGAGVRYVQELLGHAQLGTTQIYTHVSVGRLKTVHSATHPAEVPRPRPAAAKTSTP
jgi:integrase/recombinase XerD